MERSMKVVETKGGKQKIGPYLKAEKEDSQTGQ